jgi:hypothetical protein
MLIFTSAIIPLAPWPPEHTRCVHNKRQVLGVGGGYNVRSRELNFRMFTFAVYTHNNIIIISHAMHLYVDGMCTHTHTHTHTHTQTCSRVSMCVRKCVYICDNNIIIWPLYALQQQHAVRVHVLYVYTSLYVLVYIHIHICVCVCVYGIVGLSAASNYLGPSLSLHYTCRPAQTARRLLELRGHSGFDRRRSRARTEVLAHECCGSGVLERSGGEAVWGGIEKRSF